MIGYRLTTLLIFFVFFFAQRSAWTQTFHKEAKSHLSVFILEKAAWAIAQPVRTITMFPAERSAGGIHDFYSEGDYWWPDPHSPDGPYIQRDGLSNPENFTAHREAMIRFSQIVGTLASAFRLTNDTMYVVAAIPHLKAWFVEEGTRMNPHLEFAQAIKGRVTGRGIGIIDTIHLMEVAQGVLVMMKSSSFDPVVKDDVVQWFEDYLTWLTTHPNAKEEMNARNNHGTCWVMQVASFARLTDDEKLLDFCRDRFREVLLPEQMSHDGSFPLELKRTKPFGYSLFNLDAMVMVCQILSDEKNNLWTYSTPDGRSIAMAIDYLYPFIKNKALWPLSRDVMYWENWPAAHPSLLFGAMAFENRSWFELWKALPKQSEVPEVIRNLPVRNPIIWFEE